ncbi:MAG: excisionase [Ilumatobacteraceae bacterium]|nr:excisionase [Ilumatobacteraceae bacterium]
MTDWDGRLARWRDELELLAQLDEAHWVPLAIAEAEAGVSRSALRSWYRNHEIASKLVDGPNGPQRLVPLAAVVERAAKSPRLQRRAEREISLEAQVALLRHRLGEMELRLTALERRDAQPADGLRSSRSRIPGDSNIA